YYPEIDIVATPDGSPAALIHTNNCTTEINEWVNLFSEVATLCGAQINKGELFTKMFNKSLESDESVGKLVGYNYLAGEPLAKTGNGAPLIVRSPDGKLNLANFMQMQIYSANAAIALGMDILYGEGVKIDSVTAHGGFYKTEFVGQNALSATLDAPVTVMKNAGEGGAWGIALLALYTANKKGSLGEFLQEIFRNAEKVTVTASEQEKKKFAAFMQRYKANLAAERLASEVQ
ncbi:MAG: ATPase, partial [Clostridiales bacterium]|nr:ATPase [Clostridiales bacterium]